MRSEMASVIVPSITVLIITLVFTIILAKEARRVKSGHKPRRKIRSGLYVYSGGILNAIIIIYSLITIVSPGDHYHALATLVNIAVVKSLFDYGLLVFYWFIIRLFEERGDDENE